jgi:cysteinyl-tRNA synthetase
MKESLLQALAGRRQAGTHHQARLAQTDDGHSAMDNAIIKQKQKAKSTGSEIQNELGAKSRWGIGDGPGWHLQCAVCRVCLLMGQLCSAWA